MSKTQLQPATIDNVLRYLHREAVNGRHGGIEHILALMDLRGVEPSCKRSYPEDAGLRGGTRRLVLSALADGPKTPRQIADLIQAQKPDVSGKSANHRAYMALSRLEGAGVVVREGRLWGLPRKIAKEKQ